MKHLNARRSGARTEDWEERLSCGCCTGPGRNAIWRLRGSMTPEDLRDAEMALGRSLAGAETAWWSDEEEGVR